MAGRLRPEARISEGLTGPDSLPEGQPFEPPTFDCQACGACCSYSADWPRFTLESDEELDYLPPELVRADLSGMACTGDRCLALAGTVGTFTRCTIHPIRPDVCRACMPGDPECLMARAFHGLPAPEFARAISTAG